jgi:pyridoxal phosphate enzyme (YggS family)
MSPLQQRLAENLAALRDEMQSACDRAGRSMNDVTLVAVTKYAEPDWVRELAALGVSDLGENRPQQLVERNRQLPDVRWHLIGHLQRNKVRAVLPCTALIHSVDSWKLLERIGQIAGELGSSAKVLLEVNVSSEASKDGFEAHALLADWRCQPRVENVAVEGLMTMAPLSDDPEQSRPVFRRLRDLRDEMQALRPEFALSCLSMGMSGDFAIAIEEGATHIRVGSRLFAGL